ncbi:hypothetical protein D3C86_1395700 [compost metagenome]
MGHTSRQPGRPAGWQQIDLVAQLYRHAPGLGKQQLVALMHMLAGIMPTQRGGNADHAAIQAVGVERVIGKNKGHVSDY